MLRSSLLDFLKTVPSKETDTCRMRLQSAQENKLKLQGGRTQVERSPGPGQTHALGLPTAPQMGISVTHNHLLKSVSPLERTYTVSWAETRSYRCASCLTWNKPQGFGHEGTRSLRALDINLGSSGTAQHTCEEAGSGVCKRSLRLSLCSQMCAHAWRLHGSYLPEWKADRADPGVCLEFIFRMVALYHHTSKPDHGKCVRTPPQQWPTSPPWGAQTSGAKWMRQRVDKVLWPERIMVDNSFDWLYHLHKKMRRMTETNYQ